jgi:hypothetical protein
MPEASPIIISESATHVVIALELSKATLRRHLRFLENLAEAASRASAPPIGDDA